jgi:hypothetical protein
MAQYSNPDLPGRRNALKIISAIGATCAYPYASDELYGQTVEHQHAAAPPAPAPAKPSFFNEEEFQIISKVADLIIPPTDTPGAVGAGVPIYIDTVVSRNKAQQSLMKDGIAHLKKHNFLDKTEDQQLAILLPLCEKSDAGQTKDKEVQFFHLMKNLTADGYYTSQTGLIKELQYTGNTAMAEFPTCVHEH